jgi:hypothetical protein
MISKPKLTIDKFSGMSNEGGTFYLDGFSVENENGVQSLDEKYTISEVNNSSDTGFTNMNNIVAITNVFTLPDSTSSGALTGYPLMLNDNSKLFTHFSFPGNSGEIGGISSSGDYRNTSRGDLFQLPSGKILYTTARHLSLIVRGTVDAGSSTTTIIDKDGRDFTTLGIEIGFTVTNIIKRKQYEITSITTTNNTNDTLNFTAVDSSPNEDTDEFMVFIYEYKDFNFVDGDSTNTTTGNPITVPTFKGQIDQFRWSRPIKQYGDQYIIANGNYISLLANDESTIDNTYKQLPVGYQILAMEVNGSRILISVVDMKGKGHILLWDGFSSGWNEILDIEIAPKAIYPSGQGWIYLLDSTIYYTDGRNIQELISYPENTKDTALNTTNFNAITSLDNSFFFCVDGYPGTRSEDGVLVYNPKNGLQFFKCKSNGRGFPTPYCAYVNTGVRLDQDYSSSSQLMVAGEEFHNVVNFYRSSTDTKDYKAFLLFIDLKQETKISEVWLNIKRGTKNRTNFSGRDNATISVNYGDNKTPILSYLSVKPVSPTTVENTIGAEYPGVVGQEVEFVGSEGISAISGQRTFIQSINRPGESLENWQIDPPLSDTLSNNQTARGWGLFNAETKDISISDLSKPLRFPVNFLGDKMWLEVVVRGTSNSFPISINNIQLF